MPAILSSESAYLVVDIASKLEIMGSKPKWALYFFIETEEVDVGPASWIVERADVDLHQLVINKTVVAVKWPAAGKRSKKSDDDKQFAAKILQLSGILCF